MPIFPTDRTHVGFQASSLPYLRRLQVWIYPLVMLFFDAANYAAGLGRGYAELCSNCGIMRSFVHPDPEITL